MEVFFGLNKNMGKSQDVQAWKKPRRDLNALEWLFVTRCRALRWERLPQPATAPRRQRQMRTCDKNQGTGRLCLGDDKCIMDGSVTSRPQRLERVMGLSQEGPEEGWGQVWVPQGTAGRAAPAQPPHPPAPDPTTRPARAQLFLLGLTSFPTAAAFPDFKPLAGFLQRVDAFAEINFGLQLLKRCPFVHQAD